MTAPPIPDQPQLFCASCQRWLPRAAIVAARWVQRGSGRQAQYRCQSCQDAMTRRLEQPRRGG